MPAMKTAVTTWPCASAEERHGGGGLHHHNAVEDEVPESDGTAEARWLGGHGRFDCTTGRRV